jgi:hypothetical protein
LVRVAGYLARIWVKAGSGQGEASTEFALASPETNSPAVSSSIPASLEVGAGSVMMGSLSSTESAQLAPVGVEENTVQREPTQIVPETLLTSSEFSQTVPVVVEEAPDLIDLGQISPENTQTATPAKTSSPSGLPASSATSSASLPSPISSPTSPAPQSSSLAIAGSSIDPGSLSVPLSQMPSPKTSGLIDPHVLPIPEPQLLVNGLTESQAWYLGWMRESTRCNEVLDAIDRIEAQTRRKNEVAPPPVCSMELSQLKAKLEAGIGVDNR